MHAMVDLPDALRPVIQTVTPFCPSSCSRSGRVTEPSCQVMLVAFCSAIPISKNFSHRRGAENAEKDIFVFPLRPLRFCGEKLLLLEQRRAEVAFAEAGEDDDDHLAPVFRSGGDFGGGG